MPLLDKSVYSSLVSEWGYNSVDDALKAKLESMGYEGTVDDMMHAYLVSTLGETGSLSDLVARWGGTFGSSNAFNSFYWSYRDGSLTSEDTVLDPFETGPSISELLNQIAGESNASHSTFSELMIRSEGLGLPTALAQNGDNYASFVFSDGDQARTDWAVGALLYMGSGSKGRAVINLANSSGVSIISPMLSSTVSGNLNILGTNKAVLTSDPGWIAVVAGVRNSVEKFSWSRGNGGSDSIDEAYTDLGGVLTFDRVRFGHLGNGGFAPYFLAAGVYEGTMTDGDIETMADQLYDFGVSKGVLP